jgi:hypothetical protein
VVGQESSQPNLQVWAKQPSWMTYYDSSKTNGVKRHQKRPVSNRSFCAEWHFLQRPRPSVALPSVSLLIAYYDSFKMPFEHYFGSACHLCELDCLCRYDSSPQHDFHHVTVDRHLTYVVISMGTHKKFLRSRFPFFVEA